MKGRYADHGFAPPHGYGKTPPPPCRSLQNRAGKGNCYDNDMVKTVFKTIKSELIWRTIWQSRLQTEIAIGRYIDGLYQFQEILTLAVCNGLR